MSTEITTPQNFEEKMKARIKEGIGDLITDEELSKMVHRSMEEIFFKERTRGDGWRSSTVPPLMHEIVKELLTVAVTNEVREYIKAHPNEVIAAIKTAIQEGMGNALMSAITQRFQCDLINLHQSILTNLQK